MPTKTLEQLAQFVSGKVRGDAEIKISSVATLENAGPSDISFLANQKYAKVLETTKAAAVIVGKDVDCPASLLIVEDPYYAFMQIVVLLYGHRQHKKTGLSKKASISETAHIGDGCQVYDFATVSDNAVIGKNTVIYPGVFVGPDVKIGDNCILYPNATIYDGCILGNDVIINSNTTIGKDGYGYATHKGKHHKIPQIGKVIIEDDVEIGCNCGIQRGTLEDTVIGKGCKFGDLISIGHGAKIGPYCLFVGQIGVAGSTKIGHHCVIAGQVGIVGHIKIGNCVKIAAQAGVINDIPDGQAVAGTPAISALSAKRAYSIIEDLPEIKKAIGRLEKSSNNE
ncbi:MAG: UDP-3-O-(3-hydroxymyristoyl)glucosamine N-acyltransferase [Planctomycetes bacterium]|nr:UDP-3-O-(3-hydroxymyristoyl)glucosamine N-acyltransferase [Planctomycetota bacterium]MBU1517864.1 UDP-3-O-(3-hydroxymyristoyl)glucosamine N-acyltransferase [Planctomycetota bacterium]MBU2458000.1 UDP-3-O-(3-hydroxymyristoyl)glucosamine N-acyltransferase [Planctomycetota bacterium]MBU2596262.1 UDP-3-O-(3-hydroxymyristoyl)glucosamine N-acyltransferase [Planctomycetota bacterium]